MTKIQGDKAAFYQEVNTQLHHLLEGETDWIANLANAASLLYMQMESINWSGFYLYRDEQLILGPFMGNAICPIHANLAERHIENVDLSTHLLMLCDWGIDVHLVNE